MNKMMIETGIVIDDVETVMECVRELASIRIDSEHTLQKFMTNEKATKFYIDSKGASKMAPDRDTIYLWIDTGLTDCKGNPIFVSLLKNEDGFTGHFVGTAQILSGAIKKYFSRNLKDIKRNMGNFRGKYEQKIADRTCKHIEDENAYLLQCVNGTTENNSFLEQLSKIAAEYEFAMDEEVVEETWVEEEAEKPYELPDYQKEITVGLLLETIEDMQNYIEELLAELEICKTEDVARIAELEKRNEEYKNALVNIRLFQNVENLKEEENDDLSGHSLLGKKGKILVLGACEVDEKDMCGIGKLYGFRKTDFDFETDYKRVVSVAGRLNKGEKYSAIILGACPHKVKNLGEWSSLVEKCKQDENMPLSVDARNKAGELKVTKESFKEALLMVYQGLNPEWAA